jgi:hypothetical protein
MPGTSVGWKRPGIWTPGVSPGCKKHTIPPNKMKHWIRIKRLNSLTKMETSVIQKNSWKKSHLAPGDVRNCEKRILCWVSIRPINGNIPDMQ